MFIKQIKDVLQKKAPVGAKRSPMWSKVRKEFLKQHPECAVCKDKRKLEVHHIKPFHLFPELELEPTNLLTMCESKSYGIICHLLVGHNGDYKKYNLNVIADAMHWQKRLFG
jgi:5-methylcytosine-specific restriction protein A